MHLLIILLILITSCTDVNVKEIPCNCKFIIDTDMACNQDDAGDQKEDTDNI